MGLAVIDSLGGVDELGVTDRFIERCGNPARARYSRTCSAMNSKNVTTNSG